VESLIQPIRIINTMTTRRKIFSLLLHYLTFCGTRVEVIGRSWWASSRTSSAKLDIA
jgi:hypothetical protein